MRRQRGSLDNDFMKQIVEPVVSGSASQVKLAREHRISLILINRWKKEYRV